MVQWCGNVLSILSLGDRLVPPHFFKTTNKLYRILQSASVIIFHIETPGYVNMFSLLDRESEQVLLLIMINVICSTDDVMLAKSFSEATS